MGPGIGRGCFVASLDQAIECGVDFIDTADVSGNSRSERLLGRLKRHHREEVFVATNTLRDAILRHRCEASRPHDPERGGHDLSERTVEGYSRSNLG